MSTSSDARRQRPLMATVNEEMDRIHGSLGLPDSEFFCECGHVACKERITLSRAEYATLVEESCPVIVAAHADREEPTETAQHELRASALSR